MKLLLNFGKLFFLTIMMAVFIFACEEAEDPDKNCRYFGSSEDCSSSYPYSCDDSGSCYTTLSICENSSECD